MIPVIFALLLTLAMLAVIWTDATTYKISNRLNGCIGLAFAVGGFLLPIDAVWSVLTAVTVLTVGLGIFALGIMGGGDIKLLTVLSLWTGWTAATPQLIMLTGLMGGLLILFLLPLRRLIPDVWTKCFPRRPLPRILTRGEVIPYGLAIASAFLILLWTGMVPSVMPVLP